MRIAIATPVFPPYRGGIGTVAESHARVLARLGQEVSVFTPDYGHDHPLTKTVSATCGKVPDTVFASPDHPPQRGGGIVRLKPVLKHGNAAWVPQLERQLQNFDAVILQYPFFGGMAAVLRAKKKYGFRLIVNYNMDVIGSGLKGLVFWYATRFFLPKIIKAADYVLASSEDYAKHSDLRRFWSGDPKFKIVPIGVDLERFTFNPEPRENMVLFVGGLDRAHYFKGVEYLIRAIPHVSLRGSEQYSANDRGNLNNAPQSAHQIASSASTSPRNDTFKVIIAGKGELAEQYKKQARELGVSDRVSFPGGVSDEELVKLYQTAAVTVLPSIDQSESFGIVLAESMACGTPVISSNLPGVRSVYEDGVSGITVPVRDEQALADAINTMLANPSKARGMGRSARDLVEKRYTWDSIGEQLLTLCGGS